MKKVTKKKVTKREERAALLAGQAEWLRQRREKVKIIRKNGDCAIFVPCSKREWLKVSKELAKRKQIVVLVAPQIDSPVVGSAVLMEA